MLVLPFARLRHLAVLALFSLEGCLQLGAVPDDPLITPRDAAVDAADVAAADVSTTPCAQDGAGRLRVAVSLAPSLLERTADVWLAVQCNEGASPVRLVRWDRSPTQILDGFGPGTYRVFGSSFLAPGRWSTMAALEGVATSAVSLTLPSDGALLASVSSERPAGAVDAGEVDAGEVDAGASEPDVHDGSAVPVWEARAPLRDAVDGPVIGWMSVVARASASNTIELRVVVQNVCATTTCRPITLISAEARSLDGDVPHGFAAADFENPTLAHGASTSLSRPLVLAGSLPDAQHKVQVALYAVAAPAARAGAQRTP